MGTVESRSKARRRINKLFLLTLGPSDLVAAKRLRTKIKKNTPFP